MLRKRDDRGAVAVEFALIAPLFFVLLFGMVDLGRLAFVQISLNSVSHELARAYALGAVSSTTQAAIITATSNGVERVAGVGLATRPAVGITVCAAADASCTPAARPTTAAWTPCTAGQYSKDVVVKVNLQFGWATPFFGSITPFRSNGGTLNLTAQGVMLCA